MGDILGQPELPQIFGPNQSQTIMTSEICYANEDPQTLQPTSISSQRNEEWLLVFTLKSSQSVGLRTP